MSVPHKHHFIPAFFLQQWAGPDGRLIEYTIKQGRLIAKPVGPNSTGFETDLYAFPELPPEEAQFIEQKFWNYADNTAAQAHQMLLGMAPVVWTEELRDAWSRFFIGVRYRHPDMMPQLRAMAKAIWEAPDPGIQPEYDRLRTSADLATPEENIAEKFPLIAVRARLNLILTMFDTEPARQTINRMKWNVLDLSEAPQVLLLSDRPVEFEHINRPQGHLSMPISPTKLFVAANDTAIIERLRDRRAKEVVTEVNKFITVRARRFVWARDRSQERFVKNRMSKQMGPTPLLRSIGAAAQPSGC